MSPNKATDIWKFVQKGEEHECWPCTLKGGDAQGHKLFSYLNSKVYAHVMVFILTKGPVPSDKIIMHKCSNPPCCNPAHLEAGTKSQNTAQGYRENPQYGMQKRGEGNGRAKLTQADADAIRANKTDSHAALGRRYGVHECSIARIRKGQSYVC